MANREQRGNKEKKKPKSDKNSKKQKHQPYGGQSAPGQSQDHPGFNPFAKKS
ncbi:MAG TPA: hypothetical protein VLX44_16655 [Xanthobacteraceae bacterium]|nr:hypothetical protein [Xanthobacteraceae bacterium]